MNEVEQELARNTMNLAALIELMADQMGELQHRVMWCEREIDRLYQKTLE